LVSQLRENLLLCSSYLPLGVSNWSVIYINTAPSTSIFLAPLPGIKEEEAPTSTTCQHFSGAVAREEEDYCKGSLACTIFYFVLVLLYFIFACIFLSKIQKISFLYSCFYLLAFSYARMV
jgi:hypothetical protein